MLCVCITGEVGGAALGCLPDSRMGWLDDVRSVEVYFGQGGVRVGLLRESGGAGYFVGFTAWSGESWS